MDALLERKYLDTRSSSELARICCNSTSLCIRYGTQRNISRAILSLTVHARSIAKRLYLSTYYNGI